MENDVSHTHLSKILHRWDVANDPLVLQLFSQPAHALHMISIPQEVKDTFRG